MRPALFIGMIHLETFYCMSNVYAHTECHKIPSWNGWTYFYLVILRHILRSSSKTAISLHFCSKTRFIYRRKWTRARTEPSGTPLAVSSQSDSSEPQDHYTYREEAFNPPQYRSADPYGCHLRYQPLSFKNEVVHEFIIGIWPPFACNVSVCKARATISESVLHIRYETAFLVEHLWHLSDWQLFGSTCIYSLDHNCPPLRRRGRGVDRLLK